jgi:hypothetical protein
VEGTLFDLAHRKDLHGTLTRLKELARRDAIRPPSTSSTLPSTSSRMLLSRRTENGETPFVIGERNSTHANHAAILRCLEESTARYPALLNQITRPSAASSR